MGDLLSRAFDIRKGEGLRASLMFLYIFLIISSLMIVKPVANSLFLSRFGASHLPYAFMLVAICVGGATSSYLRMMKKGRLKRLIVRTLQTFVICLFGFWWLLHYNLFEDWALYIFYVWVAIFAVVSSSQFWTLANIIFNAREAKRLIGFIGSGAIAGGIFGGYLTNFLAPVLGSENLLFLCMGWLGCCIPITKLVWKRAHDEAQDTFQTQKRSEKILDRPVRLLKASKHVAKLAVIVGLSVIVAKMVDFQYSAIASQSIADHDELTAFFGFWLSNFNIASLLIQLFLTRYIVGSLGVGTSLYFLPFGILIGAIATFVSPTLWSAILIKINDGSIKQSINKAGLELLTLPIPANMKKQAKAFIDVFVDSIATGVGGLLLIALTAGLHFTAPNLSLVIISLIAIWLLMIRGVRREYVRSFRTKIESTRASGLTFKNLRKESISGTMITVLQGANQRKILQVLKMARDIQSDEFLPYFMDLLSHPASEVRLEVLKNIYYYKHLDFKQHVLQLVNDPDQEVKTEALHYLFQHSNGNGAELIKTYLRHKDYRVRGAALLCAARESKDNQKLKESIQIRELVEERLERLSEIKDKQRRQFAKVNSAMIIGAANIPQLYPRLHELLKDDGPEVIKAAIFSAGQTGNREFVPFLFQYLENNLLKGFATQALASFGPEIIELLIYFMKSKNEDIELRLRIPKVIGSLGEQKSAEALLENSDYDHLEIRGEIVKALNLLKQRNPGLEFDENKVMKGILNEAKTFKELIMILNSQIQADHEIDLKISEITNLVQIKIARQNLIGKLGIRLRDNLERLFLFLGLIYAPEAIRDAYFGIKSNKTDLRANAIEFLDNVLENRLKKQIIPIVESNLGDALNQETLKRLKIKKQSEGENLGILLAGEDEELRELALQLISELKEDRFDRYIFKLLKDPDPKKKKMAQLALQKIGFLKFGTEQAETKI